MFEISYILEVISEGVGSVQFGEIVGRIVRIVLKCLKGYYGREGFYLWLVVLLVGKEYGGNGFELI